MDFFRQHILTIIVFWPLAGMIVLFFFNKENKTLIRTWANFVMVAGFIMSLPQQCDKYKPNSRTSSPVLISIPFEMARFLRDYILVMSKPASKIHNRW